MVTAGGTIEPIDPVRYISNYSSGKMGIALAEELADRGADVTLIKASTSVPVKNGRIKIVDAVSAEKMYVASVNEFSKTDAAVMCAAVADYTPTAISNSKIKKNENEWSLSLKRTKDIAAELGKMKNNQLLVGFALETNDEETNALKKLKEKNLDFIVLNSLNDEGAGFGHDTNKIKIIYRDGTSVEYPLNTKKNLSKDIADAVERNLLNS